MFEASDGWEKLCPFLGVKTPDVPYPFMNTTEEFNKRLASRPERIVEDAVARMLPKNKLGKQMISKLQVYKGDKHPHAAQKPQDLVLA